jgi:hypothetical protein
MWLKPVYMGWLAIIAIEFLIWIISGYNMSWPIIGTLAATTICLAYEIRSLHKYIENYEKNVKLLLDNKDGF